MKPLSVYFMGYCRIKITKCQTLKTKILTGKTLGRSFIYLFCNMWLMYL